jgi:uncharacterized protein (TIGR00730 family)
VPVTNVCVFCGARPGTDPAFIAAAFRLGEALAEAGIGLVYGAGGAGMMAAVADGVLRRGGQVTGVIPAALVEREHGRTDLSDLRVVDNMHERKALMYQLSAAFVALPGGLGTFEEFFETVTWTQLGLHAKPSLVLDVNGYYTPLRTMVDHALDNGFITQTDRDLIGFYDDVDALVAALVPLAATDPY